MNTLGPGSETSNPDPSQDAWLDDALAQSFPASDPLPWFHGDREPPEPAESAANVAER